MLQKALLVSTAIHVVSGKDDHVEQVGPNAELQQKKEEKAAVQESGRKLNTKPASPGTHLRTEMFSGVADCSGSPLPGTAPRALYNCQESLGGGTWETEYCDVTTGQLWKYEYDNKDCTGTGTDMGDVFGVPNNKCKDTSFAGVTTSSQKQTCMVPAPASDAWSPQQSSVAVVIGSALAWAFL